jgi:SAM-dependent methyltransferase
MVLSQDADRDRCEGGGTCLARGRSGNCDWSTARPATRPCLFFNQRLAKPRSWRNPWSKLSQLGDWLLLDLGCGYGTNPARAIRAALLIILAFALIYAVGIEMLNVERTPVRMVADQRLEPLDDRRIDQCLGVHVRLRRHSGRGPRLDEPAPERGVTSRHSARGPLHLRLQSKSDTLTERKKIRRYKTVALACQSSGS